MRILRLIQIATLLLLGSYSQAQLSFSYQSQALGLTDTTRSWGLFWGDADGNGFSDLYVSGHYKDLYLIDPSTHRTPKVYLNQDGTSFSGVALSRDGQNDFHSGGFFLFEDDHLLDLIALTGGASENILYRNSNGDMSSPDISCGPCAGIGRGRNPGFLDYNNDGRLDIVMHHAPANNVHPDHLKTLVYQQGTDNTFDESYSHVLANAQRGMVADVDGDGTPEYVIFSSDSLFVYSYNASGFELRLAEKGSYSDSDFGDFDNDGDFELILSKFSKYESLAQLYPGQIEMYLRDFPVQKEIEFTADGPFTLFIRPSKNNLVLKAGSNLVEKDKSIPLTISSSDPDFLGWSTGPFEENHVHIGYDDVSQTWKLTTNGASNAQTWISLTSEGELELLSTTNVSPENTNQLPLTLNSFIDIDGVLTIQQESLIDSDLISSIASADFDNDGDLDLITSRTNVLTKEAYGLYLNDGSANFTLATDLIDDLAGSEPGFADAVTVGDYNVDGLIDIAAINGWADERGLIEVFENTTPGNTFIEFVLHSVQSNNMAIGAMVTIHHNGTLQRTLVDGGFHNRAQDENRIHFGLGSLNTVDSVVVDWPSGISTTLSDLSAGIRHDVFESTASDLDGDGVPNDEDNCPELYNPNDQDLVYQDLDGDGFTACELDCDDDNELVYPGALDVCDGYDNDCDGIIDNNCADCSVFETPPVDLSKSFNPVNGVVDRVQLKWYKDSPNVKYSDEDAAACDIKCWPRRTLDPLTGDAFGPVIEDPDTLSFVDRKKFYPDGITPREIFKWPVKFMADGANNSNRVEPNMRYQWKVRCACYHGAGLESPWSDIKFFNTPDFDPSSGILGLGHEGLFVEPLPLSVYPNPSDGQTISLGWDSNMNMAVLVEVKDLGGRTVFSSILSSDQARTLVSFQDEGLDQGVYLIVLTQADRMYQTRLIVK